MSHTGMVTEVICKPNRNFMSGRKRSNENYLPQGKLVRLLDMIAKLHHLKMRIKEMAVFMNTSQRTVFRYLDQMEKMGFETDKDFENRYFIIPGKCPICNQQPITNER